MTPFGYSGGLDFNESSAATTWTITYGSSFSGKPLLLLSILSFTASNQKDIDVAVSVLNPSATKFIVDIQYGSGLDFTMLWLGLLALDPDGSFPYIHLWHDIPYSSSDCNFIEIIQYCH